MEVVRQGLAGLPGLEAEKVVSGIHAGLGPDARTFQENEGFSMGWPVAATVGALATLAFLVLWMLPGERDDGLRAKGAASLQVVRERGGTVSETRSGDVFEPGDRLRFRVDVPSRSHLMVVGVEASGASYTCFPSDGSDDSRLVEPGSGRVLPGAVRLDASLGEEWLYLVLCPHPFNRHDILPGEAGVIGVPDGCSTRAFEMQKVKD
jgi:hypothetical protein